MSSNHAISPETSGSHEQQDLKKFPSETYDVKAHDDSSKLKKNYDKIVGISQEGTVHIVIIALVRFP